MTSHSDGESRARVLVLIRCMFPTPGAYNCKTSRLEARALDSSSGCIAARDPGDSLTIEADYRPAVAKTQMRIALADRAIGI